MTVPKEKLLNIYYNDYINGRTLSSLERKYNIRNSYLSRWFKKLNLPVRDNSINSLKYTFNEDYFENIDTQDKAYWLGFIYADGYIQTKQKYSNRKLGISLSVKDEEHLYKFRKCIQGTMPIKTYKTNSGYSNKTVYSRIMITSEKLTDDLIKHGVVENKSNILKRPEISQCLIQHFIRGYFDGDGSAWKQKNSKQKIPQYSIGFVGTDDILNYIMENLIDSEVINRKYKLNKRKQTHIVSNFRFGGNNQTIRFFEYIYNNANTYLERKHNIYLQLIDSRS